MKASTKAVVLCLVAVLSAGCSAGTRRKVLTFFFDGVPPPKTAGTGGAASAGAQAGAASPANATVTSWEHGPYAAKLCGGCHEAGATNALVVPKDQLCLRCHQLRMDKKYVHGPLASGGCLVCHDAHSSRYRYLLVSEAATFCFYCHDRRLVAANGAHSQAAGMDCTACHDPHMSDQQYLLK